MVVNRKQPAAPAPVSRSSSSQPVPTKKDPKPPSTTSNGRSTDTRKLVPAPTKTKPPASKQKKPVKHRPKSLLDQLFVLLLSLFTIYSFYICRPNPIFNSPPPFTPEPALCTSLAAYRTHFLEPYVLPTLKSTLVFTQTVSEPYVASVHTHLEPYLAPVHRVVSTTKPYVVRTYTTAKVLWQKTLVPLYTNTLKPYYESAILPRYLRYIQPRLVPLQKKASANYAHFVSKPISAQYTSLSLKVNKLYVLHVHPYVRVVHPRVRHLAKTTYTYVVWSYGIYNEHAHPIVKEAWIKAKPILCTAWKHSKAFVIRAADVGGALIKTGQRELGVARKTYVDPHVTKIWDKVVQGNESVEMTKEAPLAEDLSDIHETAESIPKPTPIVSADSSASSVPVQTTTESGNMHVPVVDLEPPLPTPEETLEAPAKGVKKTKAGAIPVVPEVEEFEVKVPVEEVTPISTTVDTATLLGTTSASQAVETEKTAQVETATPSHSSAATFSTPEIAVDDFPGDPGVSSSVAPSSTPEPDLDLDDFLRDLGVSSSDSSAPSAEDPEIKLSLQQNAEPAPPVDPVAEAERLAAIAAKRAALSKRHDEWFGKLEEAVKNGHLHIQEAIKTVRSQAVAYVQEMAGKVKSEKKADQEMGEDDKPLGVDIVNEIQNQGERLLLGLAGWLRKAEERSIDWKASGRASTDPTVKEHEEDTKEMREAMVKKEKEKWAQVADKVEERFGELVTKLEGDVHQWYIGIREIEGAEAMRIHREDVKRIAERAQADMGLDYAWLEDVTYKDWQRYHELMRISDRFLQTAKEMQEGTSTDPASPEDPLIPALDILNADLQDVIRGFYFSLSNTRSRAAKAFSLAPAGSEEEDDGFFAVKDGQKRSDDLRGVDLESVKKGVEEGTIAKKVGEGAGVLGVKESEQKEKADEVKILPVDDAPKGTEEEGIFDASKVVIGKDQVQIKQVLKDIPLETPAEVRHEEL